jgi:2-polyprenyl-3-methyl-5-hydroxy-6-metoxy-1,4-benzoquinol methylase
MPNINDNFFTGHYKEIWKSIIPTELTGKEVDFIIPYFNLQAGSKVLDLMCGYGRHAIALAQKGMRVTAVDNLSDYTNEIKAAIAPGNLPVTVMQCDVLEFDTTEKFDLAICMGNSLNFFDRTDTVKLLTRISSWLNEKGSLLINSWSIAEITFKDFKTRNWSETAGVKFLNESRIVFQPTRMETESTMISPDGSMEKKTGVDYIFSLNEMEAMLQEAGLQLKEVYSIPGRKKFTVGEPRAYLVAQRQ